MVLSRHRQNDLDSCQQTLRRQRVMLALGCQWHRRLQQAGRLADLQQVCHRQEFLLWTSTALRCLAVPGVAALGSEQWVAHHCYQESSAEDGHLPWEVALVHQLWDSLLALGL